MRQTIGLGVIVSAVAGLCGSASADLHAFPSAGSTVVGSVGFIDGEQIGYFWSVSRGDRVSEFLLDSNASVTRAILNVDVVTNVLNSGAFVDWAMDINGVTVDAFRVHEGFTGTVSRDVTFGAIAAIGGGYTVNLRVLNEVAGGEGSHTFAYAGRYSHSIELVPSPATAALLGLGGLMAARRRR